MAKDNPAETEIRNLNSRIAALEQLIEVYEKSVLEQTDKLFAEIAERNRAEEEVRRLNEELERKVEERTRELLAAQEELVLREKLATLGRLADSVGQELRNPLGVMTNAVYFLKSVMPDADETVREYLEIIGQEIDCSNRIIADLLDFARTRQPEQQPFPVRELVEQGLGRCSVPENVEVRVDIPETIPQVRIDPLQIGQVLRNLIANAVQAMPNGGTLHVAARRILNSELRIMNSYSKFKIQNSKFDGDFVEFSVADTGEGIAPENMEKIFQPLFSTRSRGIGLGLVVCRNLAEANGGRIEVESELGKGTTFTVLLPEE